MDGQLEDPGPEEPSHHGIDEVRTGRGSKGVAPIRLARATLELFDDRCFTKEIPSDDPRRVVCRG